jgi:hypothetical protein
MGRRAAHEQRASNSNAVATHMLSTLRRRARLVVNSFQLHRAVQADDPEGGGSQPITRD